jgi:hypothetical protein
MAPIKASRLPDAGIASAIKRIFAHRRRACTIAQARRDFEKAGVRVIEKPDGFACSSQEQPIQNFINPKAEPMDGQPVRSRRSPTRRAARITR